MVEQIAYLSNGRLFFAEDGKKPEEYLSDFGKEMKDRALKLAQKNSWKNREDNDFLSSSSLWGVNPADPAAMRVHITAVTNCINSDEIIFALSTSVVGGLFIYDKNTGKERRLFHKEGMVISDLARHQEKDKFVCSLRNADGTSFIALVGTSVCDQMTEGDCLDEAPSWIPGEEDTILYQSAGVGRNKDGIAVGLSTCSIQKLNINSGEHEEVLESSETDYLLPKMNRAGDLFYISRPYQVLGKSTSPVDAAKDVLLFAFRLGKAFLAFLNFFSLTFTKQPLTSGDNQKAKELDIQKIFLRGRMIDAQESMNNSKISKEEAPLVPPDWTLVKRAKDGSEETIAKSVVSYDFDEEENIIYSNGRATYRLNNQGRDELITKSGLIESVIAIK